MLYDWQNYHIGSRLYFYFQVCANQRGRDFPRHLMIKLTNRVFTFLLVCMVSLSSSHPVCVLRIWLAFVDLKWNVFFFLWLCQRLQIRTSKKKLQVLIYKCVLRILQLTLVRWGELHWTMADLSGKTSVEEVLRRRERKWFCQAPFSISKKALNWNCQRKRKRLSTKIWRGSLEAQIKFVGKRERERD